jgi:peptide/nickel transport system substrate-binding protein
MKFDIEIIPFPEALSAEFDSHPIGSGIFQFKTRENQKIILEANSQYFYGKPLIDKVIFYCEPDKEKTWKRLLDDKTDMAYEITPRNYQIMKYSKARFYFRHYTLPFYSILLYTTYDPLFKSPRVRQALTRAINRKQIIQDILSGYGKLAISPLSLSSPYHDPGLKPLPYDPEKALLLLKEDGWSLNRKTGYLEKDGNPFEFTLYVIKKS